MSILRKLKGGDPANLAWLDFNPEESMSSIGSCLSEDVNGNDSIPSPSCARGQPVKLERMEEEEQEEPVCPTKMMDRSSNTAQTMDNSSLRERDCMCDTSYRTNNLSSSRNTNGSIGDLSSRWDNGSSTHLSLSDSLPTLASKTATEGTFSSTRNAIWSSSGGGRSRNTRVSRRSRIQQQREAAAKACAPSSLKKGGGTPALTQRRIPVANPDHAPFVEDGEVTSGSICHCYHNDKQDERPCLVHRQSTKSNAELGRARATVPHHHCNDAKDSRPCLVYRQSTKSSAELGRARAPVHPGQNDDVKDSRPCLVYRQSTKSSAELGRARSPVHPGHHDVKDSRPCLVYRQSTKSSADLGRARSSVLPGPNDDVKDSRPCLVYRQATKSSTELGMARPAIHPGHNDYVQDSRPSLVYRQSTKSEGELHQARASISQSSNLSA